MVQNLKNINPKMKVNFLQTKEKWKDMIEI